MTSSAKQHGRGQHLDPPDGLFTPGEVAVLFRVSPKTVARWAKERKLPFIQTLGGHRRYPADAVKALLVRIERGENPFGAPEGQGGSRAVRRPGGRS